MVGIRRFYLKWVISSYGVSSCAAQKLCIMLSVHVCVLHVYVCVCVF
jgi:hypothetical protein